MTFKPLTEQDRQRNEYLDKINRAPYSTILLIGTLTFLLFTTGALLGAF
ncbi:MAG: hypothetical protein V7K47_28525 [Nostoc sp.]